MNNNLPLTPQLNPQHIKELLTTHSYVQLLENPNTPQHMKEMAVLALEMLLAVHESEISH